MHCLNRPPPLPRTPPEELPGLLPPGQTLLFSCGELPITRSRRFWRVDLGVAIPPGELPESISPQPWGGGARSSLGPGTCPRGGVCTSRLEFFLRAPPLKGGPFRLSPAGLGCPSAAAGGSPSLGSQPGLGDAASGHRPLSRVSTRPSNAPREQLLDSGSAVTEMLGRSRGDTASDDVALSKNLFLRCTYLEPSAGSVRTVATALTSSLKRARARVRCSGSPPRAPLKCCTSSACGARPPRSERKRSTASGLSSADLSILGRAARLAAGSLTRPHFGRLQNAGF